MVSTINNKPNAGPRLWTFWGPVSVLQAHRCHLPLCTSTRSIERGVVVLGVRTTAGQQEGRNTLLLDPLQDTQVMAPGGTGPPARTIIVAHLEHLLPGASALRCPDSR